ncbi:DNA (cytosine-5)-methyltransferase 1 [Micromonospora sp. HB375]|uniref:DNA cytosine methyltransferase n=1 Tax=unclassified Micromonospora TaxID=2617518 RepID=UPI001AE886F7|nr:MULTISPECIES: DNA (cytosine-5-)-methyltransferase [unclassified Micromonospora]MBP1781164.1 DNA (cytosine-5)-methyltransferase 1 [Micromonospora sp. HB375]MDH6471172.1 DNA (cytosine-5)-methyltransferase 1 [Micromonospora sp. H404/HB375]
MESTPIRAAEFFAGIGLVRTALERVKGAQVQVVWANDIKQAKSDAYVANYPDAEDHFVVLDIREVAAQDLPSGIELATSSFPCVDLSLAGNRRGLVGEQSGMFWEFARILRGMSPRPAVVLLENVHGFATSHGGGDLTAALVCLAELGYSVDVFAIDARHFVPQSRPRMFIVGIQKDSVPGWVKFDIPPVSDVRPPWVVAIHEKHGKALGMHYADLPMLPEGPQDLEGFVEKEVSPALWWDEGRVDAFVNSLSEVQKARFDALLAGDVVAYRTAYRRTRQGVSMWELRKDAIAGCLRTTGGGSSKQALVRLGRGSKAIRWMTPREYANLMGAHDYKLIAGTPNQQLFGFGDAVVVDVIEWIGNHYLAPVLRPHGATLAE